MSRINRTITHLLLGALLFTTVTALSGCAGIAAAQEGTGNPARSITVIGEGEVSAAPTLAQVSLGVETFALTVTEANEQNNTKMAALMAKLEELGIADKDIQTSNFSINLERESYPDRDVATAAEPRYRISNMVTVKIRDLDKVGTILDGIIQSGANQVWGVSFTIEDTDELEGQARSKAVEDARQRAQALAELNSVSLGQVLLVSEGGTGGIGTMARDVMMVAGKGETSISPGEVQVSYRVQVTYAIR